MQVIFRVLIAGGLLALFGQQLASADDFPTRPIRVIVGYTPGGPSDTAARLMSEPLSRQLGQPVVIENVPGGGGLNSTESFAKYPPDGYTILLGAIGPLAIIPAAKKVNYDPLNDFTPLGLVWKMPLALGISPTLGMKTLKEFITYAKASQGKVTIASAGVGSITHLAIILFMQEAGLQVVHVPYRSAGDEMTAVMGGHIDALFADAPIMAPQIKAGKIVALAVAAKQRVSVVPDVPTMAEAGQPMEVASWFGFVVSSKTPASIVKRLQDAITAAQKDPDYLQKLAKQGGSFGEPGPQGYATVIKDDVAKWKTVIDQAGIKLDVD